MILKKDKGQVVILMLLVMVIALAIALSLITRSNVEVSTSRKSEDSSRAFSAAEASLERAINTNSPLLGSGTTSVSNINFDSQVGANVAIVDLPLSGRAMEVPPFGKEAFAQFWLANPTTLGSGYSDGNFELYFGVPKDYTSTPDERPGIEATVLTKDSLGAYKSYQYYYDSIQTGGPINDPTGRSNKFYGCNLKCTDSTPFNPVTNLCPSVTTNNNKTSTFYCKVIVPATGSLPYSSETLIMVRVRILFTNTAQPVALNPLGGKSLPKQFNIYTAVGTSGNVIRTLEVFQQKSVMPQIFDFVLFSAQGLSK